MCNIEQIPVYLLRYCRLQCCRFGPLYYLPASGPLFAPCAIQVTRADLEEPPLGRARDLGFRTSPSTPFTCRRDPSADRASAADDTRDIANHLERFELSARSFGPVGMLQKSFCSVRLRTLRLGFFQDKDSGIDPTVIPPQASRPRRYSRREPRELSRRARAHSKPSRTCHIGAYLANQ